MHDEASTEAPRRQDAPAAEDGDESAGIRPPSEIVRDLRAAVRRIPIRHVERVGLSIPIVVVVVMAFTKRWTSGFGFLYFRVVEQITAGNGPVFNAGQRVEVVASPAWTAILTVANIASPIRLEWTAVVVSLAMLAGAMALATFASSTVMRSLEPGAVLVPLGSAAFAAVWPVWIWASGGTETSLVCLWIAAAFWSMTRWAVNTGPPGRWLTAPTSTLIVAGAGWIVRPELAPTSAVFVAVVVAVSARTWRQRLGTIALASTIPLAYQVFRMGYYGLLVPIGALSRDATTARPGDGWTFVWNFAGPYALVIPLVAMTLGILTPLTLRAGAGGPPRLRIVALTIAGGGVVHAAALVIVGGDFVHARLLVPSLFAVLAPCFAVPVARRLAVPIIVAAAWTPVCMFILRTDGRSGDVVGTLYAGAGEVTHEDLGWPTRGPTPRGLIGPGLYRVDDTGTELQPLYVVSADQHIVAATSNPGLVGYSLGVDVDIIDLSGSVEPTVVHIGERAAWFGGFVKNVPSAWVLANVTNSATAVVPGLFDTSTLVYTDPTGLAGTESAAWADRAVTCGALATFENSYRDRLDPGRFVGNLWDSFANTVLRHPQSTEGAAFALCGADTPVSINRLLQPRQGPVLETAPAEGTIAITSDCDVVTVVDQQRQWRVLHATGWSASVRLDPAARTRERVTVFRFGPFDARDSSSEVAVETDGAGHVRVTVTTDFIGVDATDWFDLTSVPIAIEATPDLLAQRWEIIAGFGVLAELPMTADVGSGTVVIQAQQGTDDVEYVGSPLPPSCQTMSRPVT